MIILKEEDYTYVAIFASIILMLVSLEHIQLPEWLKTVVNILDQYSYTLYLMHGVVFCSLLDRLNALGTSKVFIAGLAIIGTFLSTWLVGHYIEKPLQNWLRKNIC